MYTKLGKESNRYEGTKLFKRTICLEILKFLEQIMEKLKNEEIN